MPAGIKFNRFEGSGAIAHALLTKHKVKEYYGYPEYNKPTRNRVYLTGDIPYEVTNASQHAYAGGRIELIRYGHYTGGITYDDVCSDYPDKMRRLPALSTGKWSHVTSKNIDVLPWSLYKIRWDYTKSDHPFFPFFYRSWPGAITFPQVGYNWVWTPELEVALKYIDRMHGVIKIEEAWQYNPTRVVYPYEFVEDLYETRRKLKEQGNGMQLVYKLAINSFYGKTIQHLGYEDHESRGDTSWRPPFYQLQYGGLITSMARAQIFDAAMSSPYHIIGFATDGLWSTEDLSLDIGNRLGQWEHERLNEVTFVQSGVYWTHRTMDTIQKIPCPRHGQYCKCVEHYRGFDKDSLHEQDVLDAWEADKPFIEIPSTRFVTLGLGLQLQDFSRWHNWETTERRLKLHPTGPSDKRSPMYKHPRPSEDLVSTYPNNDKVQYNRSKVEMSDQFPLPWSKERIEYNSITHDSRQFDDMIEEE